MSNDPTELSALIPGNFIMGTSLTSLSENDLSSTYIPSLERCPKNLPKFWEELVIGLSAASSTAEKVVQDQTKFES